MSHADDIQRFLEAMTTLEHTRPVPYGRPGELPFVTISRQAGAGGHRLAETLIEVMDKEPDTRLFRGWQVFDQWLCETLAQDSRLDVSMKSLLSEEYHSQIQEFVLGLFGGHTDQYLVMKRMFETLRALAALGKVIIVGRAGSQVTRKLKAGVHVRLVAPEPLRVRRMMKLLKQSEEHARSTLQQRDRDRARLLKSCFQADIDDPLRYDAVWNTGRVDFETIAETIVTLIKHRMRNRRAEAGG